MDLRTAIDEASATLTPLEMNKDVAGPGGQAYDLAPTPRLLLKNEEEPFPLGQFFLAMGLFGFGVGIVWLSRTVVAR